MAGDPAAQDDADRVEKIQTLFLAYKELYRNLKQLEKDIVAVREEIYTVADKTDMKAILEKIARLN